MPIREFECLPCGFRTERVEFTPDPDAPICPRCDTVMTKAISRSSFRLEGHGWTRPVTYNKPRRGSE
jgi:putative FmdB family regulatory protein